MSQKNRARLDVRSLLLGLTFGFGTNLVTANPEDWWTPLRAIDQYAPIWLVAGISATLLYEGTVRYRERHQRSWQGSDSPYAGLSAYTADRSEVFFGREPETEQLLSRLDRSGVGPSMRFIPVVGPSGVGKSSFVQAGVLPALNRRWTIIGPIRPGPSPFLALADALIPRDEASRQKRRHLVEKQARLLRDEAAQLQRTGAGRPDLLLSLIANEQPGTQRLLIFVDQLEETITLVSPDERASFLALLRAGMTALPTIHILATLRPDALAEFGSGPDAPLFAHPFRVGPLDSQRLRDVILKPAAAAGLKIERQVVEQMLAEATVGDTLPLLSHLLERLHLNSGAEGVITSEAFNRVGRVIGAITEHAEEVYESLLAVYQPKEIDDALLRFVSWGTREPIRKPVPKHDLDLVSGRVVEEFRSARLIVDIDNGTSLDLAHDALLRQWKRLNDLVAQDEDRLRSIALLELRAQRWSLSFRPADDLLRGAPLEDARALVAEGSITSLVREFLAESQAQVEEDAIRKADDAAERALMFRKQDRELAIAGAREAARSAPASSTAALAVWALVEKPEVERLPIGHIAKMLCFSWLPDSSGIVSVAQDRSVCLWAVNGDLSRISVLPHEDEAQLKLAKISVDGSRVLLVEHDNHSSLWDVQKVHCLGKSKFAMESRLNLKAYEWSPDGFLLAGQPDYSDIIVWTVADKDTAKEGIPQRVLAAPHVTTLSWSPDQTAIAYLTDSTLCVVSITSPDADPIQIEVEHPCPFLSWSPDSRSIAIAERIAGRRRNRVRIIDRQTATESGSWLVNPIHGLAWSPDGRRVAITMQSRLPDPEIYSGKRKRHSHGVVEIRDIEGHLESRKIVSRFDQDRLSWSPDGKCIALAEQMGSRISIWHLGSNEVTVISDSAIHRTACMPGGEKIIIGHGSPPKLLLLTRNSDGEGYNIVKRITADSRLGLKHLAWSPEGDRFTIGVDKIEVRDAATGSRLHHLPYSPAFLGGLAWSPDGRYIATSSHDFFLREESRVVVWDVQGEHPVAAMAGTGLHSGPVAWSRSGAWLAGVGEDGAILIWDPRTGDVSARIACPDATTKKLAWSPQEDYLALGGDDGRVRIWNVSATELVSNCLGHVSGIERLAWKPDGSMLASADGHDVRLWSPPSGRTLAILDIPQRLANDLVWSGSGRELTLAASDGTVRTWTLPADSSAVVAKANALPLPELTSADRARFGIPPEISEDID